MPPERRVFRLVSVRYPQVIGSAAGGREGAGGRGEGGGLSALIGLARGEGGGLLAGTFAAGLLTGLLTGLGLVRPAGWEPPSS